MITHPSIDDAARMVMNNYKQSKLEDPTVEWQDVLLTAAGVPVQPNIPQMKIITLTSVISMASLLTADAS